MKGNTQVRINEGRMGICPYSLYPSRAAERDGLKGGVGLSVGCAACGSERVRAFITFMRGVAASITVRPSENRDRLEMAKGAYPGSPCTAPHAACGGIRNRHGRCLPGAGAQMGDARFADVLSEMVEKQRSARLATVLMWCGIAFAASGQPEHLPARSLRYSHAGMRCFWIQSPTIAACRLSAPISVIGLVTRGSRKQSWPICPSAVAFKLLGQAMNV